MEPLVTQEEYDKLPVGDKVVLTPFQQAVKRHAEEAGLRPCPDTIYDKVAKQEMDDQGVRYDGPSNEVDDIEDNGKVIYENMKRTSTARRFTITLKGLLPLDAESLYETILAHCKENDDPSILDLHMALHDKDEVHDGTHIHIGVALKYPLQLGAVLNKLIPKGTKMPKKIWAESMKAMISAHEAYIERGSIHYNMLKQSNRKDNVKRDGLDYVRLANEFLESGLTFDEWTLAKVGETPRIIHDLKNVEKIVNVQQRVMARSSSLEKRVIKRRNMYSWQKQMEDILEGDEDERKIHVMMDKAGNTGKSSYSLSYYVQNPTDVIIVQNGRTQDIAHIVSKENQALLRVVFVDLCRSNEDHINYDVIERIKNGFITSAKYDSQNIVLSKAPHVVMYTNEHLDYSRMSDDRWKVYEVVPNPFKKKDYIMRPLTLAEAKEAYRKYQELKQQNMYKM